MKYIPIQNQSRTFLIQSVILVFAVMLLSKNICAQTYYSNFSSATNKYNSTSPTGFLCLSPSFSNDQNIATADLTDYAQISGLLSETLTCNTSDYLIRAALNLPNGTTEAPAGYNAGFHVRFGSVASLALLQNNLSLKTYLAGVLRENVPGSNLAGVSLLTGGSASDIFFTSTLSFDAVELDFNTSVLPVGTAFDYRFYYAFAALSTLPVKLAAFTASGPSANLVLNWTTTSETGTARFEVQRSAGTDAFSTIGTINAKTGTSSQRTYTYIDRDAFGNGERAYRLKIVDRDGSIEYSKVISIANMDAVPVKVYPNQVMQGQPITIQPNSTSTLQTDLFDASGRIVSTYKVSGRFSVSTDRLNRGVYVLKIKGVSTTAVVYKVVIQ